MDVRIERRTRYDKVHRELLMRWKGYSDPSWIDKIDLNCGALLQGFEHDQANRNRFEIMQSHEEGPCG